MSSSTMYRRGLIQAPAPSAPVEAPAARTAILHLNFRPEIEGLRAVAVLLVASYHIWFGRVSGGVDVFLLLTGFLITGSLVRMVERSGRVRFLRFWSRLAARLIPAAATALLLVVVVAYFVLPETRWRDTIDEIVASALYYENWQLATNSVDYLAQDAAVSPTQHFWSLAIQGQFYILWAVAIAGIALVVKRTKLQLRPTVAFFCAAVFSVSLAYSIWRTADNQPWAYFDTGARLWELALGGLLAMVLEYIRPANWFRLICGWLGLTALVSCGLLVNVSTMFPGYIALWPMAAAALVIIAGTSGSRYSADRWLTWRPLTFIGGLGYTLYLVHWPLLIAYRELTGEAKASWYGGLYVLALSFMVAFAVKWMMEDGVSWVIRSRTRFKSAWSLAAGVLYLVPVLLVSSVWVGELDREREQLEQTVASDPVTYPGAMVLSDPQLAANLPDAPVYPQPADARTDVPVVYPDDCHVDMDVTNATVCEYGNPNGEYTIALVGASRTAHWFPALESIVNDRGWRLLSITKSFCQFDTDVPQRSGGEYTECIEWRENVVNRLAELKPDLVVTSSTRATDNGELVHPGFVERWRQLDDLGIDVMGIRDLPRAEFDVPECLEAEGADGCVFAADATQADIDPATIMFGVPSNVTLVDLTDYVCPERQCPPVIGNILVYRDTKHLTATYAATMAPIVEDELLRATGW